MQELIEHVMVFLTEEEKAVMVCILSRINGVITSEIQGMAWKKGVLAY